MISHAYINENFNKKKCLIGAVIGKNLVITAAHCLERSQMQSLRVVIGDHILDERDLHEHSYRVQSVVLHPDFRKDGPYSNDIAIIKLKAHRIGFNTHVRPICLPDPNETIPAGTICSVTGWGIQRCFFVKILLKKSFRYNSFLLVINVTGQRI